MKDLLNKKAPEFSLPDQSGDIHKLSDYKGKWILIYFYPRDNTPGCTIEACTLRDSFPKFSRLKAEVLGVSKDSIESHEKFKAKYKLPFTLLSDDKMEMLKAYGVWQKKKFLGKEFMGIARTSFLINPQGKIVKIYEKVKPPVHAEEVLNDLKSLQ
ncbi:MAG: thioredoxin-dependent thiol peroxidase [Patescibacteria group bacterium]